MSSAAYWIVLAPRPSMAKNGPRWLEKRDLVFKILLYISKTLSSQLMPTSIMPVVWRCSNYRRRSWNYKNQAPSHSGESKIRDVAQVHFARVSEYVKSLVACIACLWSKASTAAPLFFLGQFGFGQSGEELLNNNYYYLYDAHLNGFLQPL